MAYFSLPVHSYCGKMSNLANGTLVLAAESKADADAIVTHVSCCTLGRATSSPSPSLAPLTHETLLRTQTT